MSDVKIEEPFPDWQAPRVWLWAEEFRGRVLDDYGPQNLRQFMQFWEERAGVDRRFAVYFSGELGGLFSLTPQSERVGVGHCLFRKDFWGHQFTVPALRAVLQMVFAEGYERIVSFPFADNRQLLHLVRQVGGEKEGILRQQTLRNGKPTDVMAIGILKGDFEKCLLPSPHRSSQPPLAAEPESLPLPSATAPATEPAPAPKTATPAPAAAAPEG